MHSIPMQASIGAMSQNVANGGETVFAELDIASGVLLIDASLTMKAGAVEVRRGDAAVVTNNVNADDYDLLFTEADMRDAITDYFSFAGRGLLVLDTRKGDAAEALYRDTGALFATYQRAGTTRAAAWPKTLAADAPADPPARGSPPG